MTGWQKIETAPKNGRTVKLGWISNGQIEYETTSFWRDGKWQGNWTPTHWKPLPLPSPPESAR